MFLLFDHRMKFLMEHKIIFINHNIIHIKLIIYSKHKISILTNNILVNLFLFDRLKIMKIFFFGFSLAYPIPHTYTPPTSSTQISNQPQSQSQYPATNNQLQTQSSQTSQQSSVMIIYSFRF
jgi:hypothetical protein